MVLSSTLENTRLRKPGADLGRGCTGSTYLLFLELYNILAHVQFTTSKIKLGIYYGKLGIRVVSRVAELLKTDDLRKLGKLRDKENFKFGRTHSLVPSPPSRN